MRRPSVGISRLIVLLLVVLIWEIITQANILNFFVLPKPLQVATAFVQMIANTPTSISVIPGGFYSNLGVTLYEIFVAFAVSSVVGVLVGFAWGANGFLKNTFEPLLYLFYSAPSIILYPVIFLIFTVHPPSKIVFGIMLGLFPVIVNTISGFGELKPQYLKVARVSGASSQQVFTKIVLPGLAPSIMGALRLGLSYVIIGVIAGEVIAAPSGIGASIATTAFNLHMDYMWSLILVVFGLAYFLVEVVFRQLEKRMFRYASL